MKHGYRIIAKASRIFALVFLLGISFSVSADWREDVSAARNAGNYPGLIAAYKIGAEQGDAEAQLSLGVMYGNGQGVPVSYVEAYK